MYRRRHRLFGDGENMRIGVIGAGTMGCGVAQVFAKNGHEVILCGSSLTSAENGRKTILVRLERAAEREKIDIHAPEAIISRIKAGNYEDCSECGLIFEAVREDLAAKKAVFRKLSCICSHDCIFATNTSSLSITEIGAGIIQQSVGMHFFNPAPFMKLVEVTPGMDTSRKTVEAVMNLARDVGKIPVEVKESTGFIVNRLLIPMINEAAGLYAEGAASAEDIDRAMKLGANHPLGPLELGDLIGLDVVLAIMDVLHSDTGDPKYRAHPILRRMVSAGRLGRKSGRGFYSYT